MQNSISKQSMIVGFAKDWGDVPTCVTHILRRMSAFMPVLWINSIGTRKPHFSGSDIKRILYRLMCLMKRARRVENQLRVLSLLLVPSAHSVLLRRLNRMLASFFITRELRDMGRGRIEYWCFVPNAVDLLPEETIKEESGETMVIYYCVDDWSTFDGIDTELMTECERRLLARADLVFAVSRYLENKCRGILVDMGKSDDVKVYYMPHGVDYAMFSGVVHKKLPVPSDMIELPHPVIGFYGNVASWLDFKLLEKLVCMRPDWSFVFVGPLLSVPDKLRSYSNVWFIGRRSYEQLPGYCQEFDVAIIPYDLANPRMKSVNPVKTLELLSAGVPIVASDLPELRAFVDDVITCRTVEEWLDALQIQLKRSDKADISRRAEPFDWNKKVQYMREIVDLFYREKKGKLDIPLKHSNFLRISESDE